MITPSHRRPGLQRVFRLILVLVTIAGCASTPNAPTPEAKRTPIPGNAAATPRPTRPAVNPDDQTWLVMLYQNADDETLEEDIFYDFNEAELVGSTERVKVVAQLDRYDGAFEGDGDWTSTKRFLIEQDDDLEKIQSTELDDLGETNMADADTLIDFVTWAAETYPADKYVLIMSDHGAGWPGGWNDPDPPTMGRDNISLAEGFGDMLFLMELDQAFKSIMAETKIGEFELLGFDACLMSLLEVYSTFAPYAHYSVASEEVEPSLGWAYAAILGRLTDSPEIDGAELSRAIVDSYIEQDQQIIDDQARVKYLERVYDYTDDVSAEEIVQEESKSITLTAVDLTAMPNVVSALDNLVTALAEVEQKDVALARRYSQAFESVFDDKQPKPYIDLGHFAELVKDKTDDAGVDSAADALIAAIQQSIVSEKHGEDKSGATGIAIHFPNSKLYKDENAGYQSYDVVSASFVQQSLWDDFLAFHYTKKPMPEPGAQSPPSAPAGTVEAPGAAPITIDPVTLSADTVSRRNPVIIKSKVTGERVAFVYLFIGYIDPKTSDIRMIDTDFLDADEVKEVSGVFYPDWGAARNIEIEFEWNTDVFALSDGSKTEIALLTPEEYGASPAEAIYTVEGMYQTAKGKKQKRALLLMSDGDLVQVLGFTGNSTEGSPREITPKRGDRFTILEQWIKDDPQADESQVYTKEGATLTFGKDNFVWQETPAPKGEYLVGFLAEDLDGNIYETHAVVTLR